MQESRGSAILDKRAHRQTLQTGIQHVTALASEEATSQPSFLAKMKTSVSRPLLFLTTEPIVTAFSLWCGTLWGVLFIFYVSIPISFDDTYHFSIGQRGTVLSTAIVGAIIGFGLARIQDRLYDRDAARSEDGRPPPESRLYMACVGAVAVPVALLWYAWTAQPSVHWIVPCLALVVFQAGLTPIFLATFTFLVSLP